MKTTCYLFFALSLSLGLFATSAWQEPVFMDTDILPTYSSSVEQVYQGVDADLVVFQDGIRSGFANGMLCQAWDGSTLIADMILIAVEQERSVALITKLHSSQTIQSGNSVRVKTIK